MKKQKKLKIILLLSLYVFSSWHLYAQSIKIQGKVTDATSGEVLPGVNVVIKGTTQGTVTDFDGRYQITANKDAVLAFSFVGYLTEERVVTKSSTIDVVLMPSINKLSEVVVIGYGTVKKSDATGSVATVSSSDFNKGAISSAQALVVGKTAGVTITSTGGSPQDNPTIRIRGGSSISASNDPLIVIDGVPIENGSVSGGGGNPLLAINPNDVESFTILKDASATAIYGSRASNGVIMITTKKGTKKMQIGYNVVTSVGVIPKTMSVLSGDEYRSLVNELHPNTTGHDSIVKSRLGNANTDWQKQIYRNAISQDHNLSISGTTYAVPYRVSLGYTNQNGILKTTNMQRSTGAIDFSPTFLDNHLKVTINEKFSYIQNNFGDAGAVGSAIRYDPTQPVMNGNTRWGGYTANMKVVGDVDGEPLTASGRNPVAQLAFIDNKSTVKRSISNFQADYKFHFIPNLRANLNLAYDYNYGTGHNNTDSIAPWTFSSSHPSGTANSYWEKKEMQLLDFYLNYAQEIKEISSRVDVMGGYSWQHSRNESSSLTTSQGGEFIITPATNPKSEYYLVSFFGRLNYTLLERYLLTATLRNDGTSRFSSGTRWGLFPAAAFAWKINNESFLRNVNAISELKLRLGYGVTGQQNISGNNYLYLPIYTASQPTAQYQMGYNPDGTPRFYTTLRPEGYDKTIKWEETTTQNIALDYGFFNGRINGSLEYYVRKTSDLINVIPVPAGSNLKNQIMTNIGNMENRGIEFSVSTKILSNKDLFWELNYNLGYNEAKITKLTQADDPTFPGNPVGGISGGTGNAIQIQSVGYAPRSFYVLQQVYDSNGIPVEGVYADQNNDHLINGSDYYRFKKSAPTTTMGLSSRFSYKNFDFSFDSRINLDNYIYNNVASNNGYYEGNIFSSSSQLNNLIVQGYPDKFNKPQWYSDYYLENGSFFRLDNISIGYLLDKVIMKKIDIRVNATCQNVFVITKYKGLDPEVESGIDNNFYPRPRTFSLGLSVNF